MRTNGSTHVQIELTADEYERFHTFATERGLTVTEAAHEALVNWIERQQRIAPNDRAFTVLDELDASSLPAPAETDARREDDHVEDWHGSDVEFTLADNPSAQH